MNDILRYMSMDQYIENGITKALRFQCCRIFYENISFPCPMTKWFMESALFWTKCPATTIEICPSSLAVRLHDSPSGEKSFVYGVNLGSLWNGDFI